MSITCRCDRCHAETAPDKLYDVELIFTPRTLSYGEDVDKEDRHWLGQVCLACADIVEPLVKALTQPAPAQSSAVPPSVDAVREDVASPVVTSRGKEA